MEYLTSCCSLMGGSVKPGQYAFEAFKKVPQISGFQNVFKTITEMTGMTGGGSDRNLISMKNITTVVGIAQNVIGGKGTFDIAQFMRNLPISSKKATDSNIANMIGDSDVVIKKIKKSNYEALVKEHSKSKKLFTDPDFPPNQQSIGNLPKIGNPKWKRLPEIIPNLEFVSGEIEPADVLQGQLGNCYFLSAIAALAENDFRIKNLFPNLEVSPYGIYMARIMFRGVLHEVVVDDYIPVDHNDKPLFAKPNGGREIWVIIMEKAWAKLNRNYAEIIGGFPNEVLHAFSAAPTFYRSIPKSQESRESLWAEMLELEKKGGIICCGTKHDNKNMTEDEGLVPGHAYTILGVFERPRRLLKIRNPWGHVEWKHACSESDHQFWGSLSEDQIQHLGHVKKNDGTFFMLWQDFLKHFFMVDLCKINDNAHYQNIESKFDKKNGDVFELTTEGGDLTIALSQANLRAESEQRQSLGYSRSTLVLGKQTTKDKYEYIKSSSYRRYSDHYMEFHNLPKGKYIVFAKFDWIHTNPNEGCVSVYTDSKTILKSSGQSKHPAFLRSVFEDHARRNPTRRDINNNSAWVCNDFLFNESGYGYYMLENKKESERNMIFQLDEAQMRTKNLIVKRPHKGSNVIAKQLKPGDYVFVLYRLKALNYPRNGLTTPEPVIKIA